ncbi:hypothetical protein [Holdemania massiliensis]|uniref:hypothetical protein n=1 Tax=Holdemania massiliensis TaxID=1468449 RepID=UPI001F052C2E|nr:hypothetical protein [Holdemania massiliensis]MCH1942463.1 hypothetical protein [Holdemania massiliensis]
MKRCVLIVAGILAFAALMFYLGTNYLSTLEKNENEFSAEKIHLESENNEVGNLLQINHRIRIDKTHHVLFKLYMPEDFTRWEDQGEIYLIKNPDFEIEEGNLALGVSYVTYNKKDKLYYVVTDFVTDQGITSYFVECVLLMDADDLRVRIDRLNIEPSRK